MAVIVHSSGITPSSLADLEQVRRPTITRVVNGLVERGLVRRNPHPDDKRASIIVATENGSTAWLDGQLRIVAPLAERIAGLDDSERAQLEAILPLLDNLTATPDA